MSEVLSKYHIEVCIEDYIFDDIEGIIKDAIDDNDHETAEDYQNKLTFLNSIKNGVDVSTLAEYFDLLDHISEAWYEYHIFNDERFIVIGEG